MSKRRKQQKKFFLGKIFFFRLSFFWVFSFVFQRFLVKQRRTHLIKPKKLRCARPKKFEFFFDVQKRKKHQKNIFWTFFFCWPPPKKYFFFPQFFCFKIFVSLVVDFNRFTLSCTLCKKILKFFFDVQKRKKNHKTFFLAFFLLSPSQKIIVFSSIFLF